MSEQLPPEKKLDDSCPDYQRNKAPTKIPGTAVFRSPYSVSSKTGTCSPYYIMTSNTNSSVTVPNASDEDKRRIMHNEVERKRKDKINKWIVRLCTLVPECNGKLSKNTILEKTVDFIQTLMQEQKLPDDVQALKTEVIKLTKNVESLSSENAHYLTLLKEAQILSKGAWTLNMSIQRQGSLSSGSDGDDTTMTPTLDRVAVSNLTKVASAPNLPAIVPAPPKPQIPNMITVPIITASTVANTVQSAVTGQALKVTLQPQTVGTPGRIGSMVTALSANQLHTTSTVPTLLAANPIVANGHPIVANANGQPIQMATNANGHPIVANANGHPIVANANGHPILANGLPLLSNVQVKDGNVIKSTANGPSHSIQALLGSVQRDHTATTNTLYSVPTYVQPLSNGEGGTTLVAAAAGQPQTPVLVQGENGPVVIMIPGSLPHFAVPLNTMSSNQVMCEPTAYFKSPIICSQFPSLMNYTDNNAATAGQNAGLQVGSVIQGPQGQQSVVVGTQPVLAQTVPTVLAQQTGQTMLQAQTGQTVLQAQGGQATAVIQGLQSAGGQPAVVGTGQTVPMAVGVPQAGQAVFGGAANFGLQQSGATVVGVQPAQTVMQAAAHTLIQVPNSEAVLIPQTNVSSQQCFIPHQVHQVHQVHTLSEQKESIPASAAMQIPKTATSTSAVTSACLTPSKNTSVTDFSISQIHGIMGGSAGDTKQPMDAAGDIYLNSTSDTSFSGSDCFTPPYSLSSATFRDTMSPDGEESKPLAHSIASLTGNRP